MDAEEIQGFFNLKEKGSNKDTSVSLSVTGRTYPVEIFFTQGWYWYVKKDFLAVF